MVLDALIKIKNEMDGTLTFRRSCREGECGPTETLLHDAELHGLWGALVAHRVERVITPKAHS